MNEKSISSIKTSGKFSFMNERLGLIIALVALVIIFSIASEYFLTPTNIISLLQAIALGGICAAGMTAVIITGGFDLSIGSTVAFSCMAAGYMISIDIAQPFVFLLVIAVGALIGVCNGLLIAKVKINALITTLGMMTIVSGITYIVSDAKAFGIYDTTPDFPSFGFWGRGYLFGAIPTSVVLMAIVYLIVAFLLTKTIWGREIYALGGNQHAAKICGIDVDKRVISVYVLMGILAAFAGIILSSKLAAGVPNTGGGYELDAVAAVVLGGAALSGGRGKIQDTFLAVLIVGIIQNGFTIMGFSSFWQDVARGGVLLLAVGISQVRNKKDE